MKTLALSQDINTGPDQAGKPTDQAQTDGPRAANDSGLQSGPESSQSPQPPPPEGRPQAPLPEPPGRSAIAEDDLHNHWRRWLASPAGRYVLDWEQAHLDRAVANLFGFVAVQCGMRELHALRQNRMRSRFMISRSNGAAHYSEVQQPADVVIEHYEELPLATESADLIVLPHVLEFAQDPHQVLREIDRVLRPDGRVIISGFNPFSLWGIGQSVGRLLSRPPLPRDEHFIGLPRLRDWCKLLSFEFQVGSYGCYRPLVASDKWLARTQFMENAGDRWWPICGAVYSVTVVKRVRGMRVLGPRWKQASRRVQAGAVATPTFAPPRLRNSSIADYDADPFNSEQGIANPWPNPLKSLPTEPVRETRGQEAGER